MLDFLHAIQVRYNERVREGTIELPDAGHGPTRADLESVISEVMPNLIYKRSSYEQRSARYMGGRRPVMTQGE